MDEKQEEKKPSTGDSGEGDKPKRLDIVERASAEREKLEQVRDALKKENDRAEEIMARRALGGETSVGEHIEKPQEESNEDYAKKVIAGDVGN